MLLSSRVTNKYYAPGERRAVLVRDLFAAVAPRYDLINDLQSLGLHRLWKRLLLQLAAPRPGDRVLDLCCGTGDITLAFARQGLQAVGLDFSQPMLSKARARINAHDSNFHIPHLPQFIRGDAQRIPFPGNSFDIVAISYGLRNLASLEQGISEMQRVARPGARLLILDFGKPDNPLLRAFYFGYLKWCVPLLGRFFCGDADTHGYILESLQHYAAQRGVDAKLRELGLVHTRIINLAGGAMSINYAEKPR
jgi:demethylmenaquinone methyltransferase / 2-methoxy-6-polyprenyl-1,4-benzoquinol methylase